MKWPTWLRVLRHWIPTQYYKAMTAYYEWRVSRLRAAIARVNKKLKAR